MQSTIGPSDVWTLSWDDREQFLAWLQRAGCEPNRTRSVSLGEGCFVAEQYERDENGRLMWDGNGMKLLLRTFLTAEPPPAWPGMKRHGTV